jgi:hypothetical protein
VGSSALPRISPVNGPELLEHAADVVIRRRSEYGEPSDLFERVAVRWSQVLGSRITPMQVIVCLIDLKVARLAHNPRHLDSVIDVAGYASILAELLSNTSEAPAADEALIGPAGRQKQCGLS